MSNRIDPMSALRFAWAPLSGAPVFCGDVSVTTSSGVLFTDSTLTDGKTARRVRIYNTSSSATLSVFFMAAGGTATGLTASNGCKVGPGMVLDCVISNGTRVAAMGSASLTANVLVSDII